MLRASAAVAAGRIHRCTLMNGALRKLVGSVAGRGERQCKWPRMEGKEQNICDKLSSLLLRSERSESNIYASRKSAFQKARDESLCCSFRGKFFAGRVQRKKRYNHSTQRFHR